jgi:hypothetical protein
MLTLRFCTTLQVQQLLHLRSVNNEFISHTMSLLPDLAKKESGFESFQPAS